MRKRNRYSPVVFHRRYNIVIGHIRHRRRTSRQLYSTSSSDEFEEDIFDIVVGRLIYSTSSSDDYIWHRRRTIIFDIVVGRVGV